MEEGKKHFHDLGVGGSASFDHYQIDWCIFIYMFNSFWLVPVVIFKYFNTSENIWITVLSPFMHYCIHLFWSDFNE